MSGHRARRSVLELNGEGLRLRADTAGPPDGMPVLLLHGGGQTRASWGRAVDVLAEHGARAVAADLRGHGDSDWPREADYEPTHVAADVVRAAPELIRASGREQVVLVGASMGGLAALLAAAQLRGRVAGLVLVDVVPQLSAGGANRVVEFMRSAPEGFASLDEAADAVAAYLPHRSRPARPSGLRRNLRRRADGRWVWHWDPRLVHGRPIDVHARLAELEAAAGAIEVPVLLVRGLLSDVVDDEGVRRLRALVAHLRVLDLAEAGHTAAADDNDAFVESLVDFVTGLAGDAP